MQEHLDAWRVAEEENSVEDVLQKFEHVHLAQDWDACAVPAEDDCEVFFNQA